MGKTCWDFNITTHARLALTTNTGREHIVSTLDDQKIPLQLLSFRVGDESFAVDVLKIHGVERMQKITSIPKMPHFLEGVIDTREQIVPIVDLRKRFNIEAKPPAASTRIILIELDNHLAGLIVDAVFEVFQADKASIGAIPSLGTSPVDAEFLRGVVRLKDNLVIIIDMEKVFTPDEKESITAAAGQA